jgi:hypothetical protein
MKIEQDHIVFSTGKRLEVAWQTIGIKLTGNEDAGDKITIHEGSSGPIYLPGESFFTKNALTKEECIELADAMIDRWRQFRSQHED